MRGFPISLPPRNAGLSFMNPGQVVVTPSGIAVVADGFQVSAYNPNGHRLWVYSVMRSSKGVAQLVALQLLPQG